jgi:hypothetical protein
VVTSPYFPTSLSGQSILVGSTVSFNSPAVHTSGVQWQHAGTNLIGDAHYRGVTTSSLTISNAQVTDTGTFAIVASHPLNAATNSATLYVYRPITLGLGRSTPAGGFILTVANQDGSSFEPDLIPDFYVYSSTNLLLDSAWKYQTNTGALTNGVVQIKLPRDSSARKFWRVLEQ